MSGRIKVDPKVAASKAQTARLRREKDFWLNGIPERKRKRRLRGSRGAKIQVEDLGESAVNLLSRWYVSEAISEAMFRAGNRFHSELLAAHEPVVKAADLTRVKVDTSHKACERPMGGTDSASRRQVSEALGACGGLNSRIGSVLWFVVGMEFSLREWSERFDSWGIDRKAVPGLLLAALEMLVQHYTRTAPEAERATARKRRG